MLHLLSLSIDPFVWCQSAGWRDLFKHNRHDEGMAKIKTASVSEGRSAFSICLPVVVHGLVVNPVGAAGVGAGVGWFGLAWLAEVSTIVRALL